MIIVVEDIRTGKQNHFIPLVDSKVADRIAACSFSRGFRMHSLGISLWWRQFSLLGSCMYLSVFQSRQLIKLGMNQFWVIEFFDHINVLGQILKKNQWLGGVGGKRVV